MPHELSCDSIKTSSVTVELISISFVTLFSYFGLFKSSAKHAPPSLQHHPPSVRTQPRTTIMMYSQGRAARPPPSAAPPMSASSEAAYHVMISSCVHSPYVSFLYGPHTTKVLVSPHKISSLPLCRTQILLHPKLAHHLLKLFLL